MPEKPPPDYEAIESKMWKENAEAVPGELEEGSSRLGKRVQTFMGRFDFTREQVEGKIANDPMFAAHFAKEPRRQGIHEAVAADWIEELEEVTEFVVLPKGGENAVYITRDGNIHRGQLPNRPGKSLDFRWKTGGKTCYAAHKYTKEGGGTQDLTHLEMVELMKRFQSCNDQNIELFVIVDGPYYAAGKRDEIGNHARTTSPRSHAIPIEDLPGILRDLVD